MPPVNLHIRMGDDPRWASADWDDRSWDTLVYRYEDWRGGLFPSRKGPYWVRFKIVPSNIDWPTPVLWPFLWPKTGKNSPVNGIYVAAVFAFELYLDGHLIGQGGRVGHDRASEIPGPVDNLFPIPPELLGPGPHTVAMRISSHRLNFSSDTFSPIVTFENYADRLVFETKQPVFPLLAMAGALLAGMLCGFLYWFMDRRRSLLILGALSLAIAAFYFLIVWRWLHPDPYPWLARRYDVITGIMAFITLLMPWVLLEHFGFARKRLWLVLLVPLVVVSCVVPEYHWDKVIWLSRVMLGPSLLIALWAVWRRRAGSLLVLTGVVVGLVFSPPGSRGFLGPELMFTFGSILSFLLGSVAVRARVDRRRAQEALATKARLEIELLKQNIQPHFLVNTLSALTEVIENDTAAGVKFIDDLAIEFRTLARLAGERLIPLARELELCEAHLRLASVRRGLEWHLDSKDADLSFEVPPSIFLTLIENGFAHQQIRERSGTFVLRLVQMRDRVQLRFFSPGRVVPRPGRAEGGTGLKYVRARLEESFPRRWSLAQQPVEDGWETVIEIKDAARARPEVQQSLASI
ncbi:MAG: Sensor protein lytS [Verrucomicrobia bacterium]|nr:Sensor protein lytS [Verrucomicrobiota bacterium]